MSATEEANWHACRHVYDLAVGSVRTQLVCSLPVFVLQLKKQKAEEAAAQAAAVVEAREAEEAAAAAAAAAEEARKKQQAEVGRVAVASRGVAAQMFIIKCVCTGRHLESSWQWLSEQYHVRGIL